MALLTTKRIQPRLGKLGKFGPTKTYRRKLVATPAPSPASVI